MKKKVTYLIGAGASCNSLPVLNNMAARMEEQIIFLKKTDENLSLEQSEEFNQDELNEYINDLHWLINASRNHATVDTYAKNLFIKRDSHLEKLKNCLSVFLLIEQLKNAIDPRYDTFFASMLDTNLDMPMDLNIISWNYDMQFEMAYQLFTSEIMLDSVQDRLGVYLKHNSNIVNLTKKFGIYKLNGSSVAFSSNNAKLMKVYARLSNKNIAISTLKEIFKSYSLFKNNLKDYTLGLSFSWETENVQEGNDIVSITQRQTTNTEILVIIGYSIPYFNRDVDRNIIQNMSKLQKVYFQSPEADAIIERFGSIRDDINSSNLIPINNCDQFYIPNEL